MRSALEPMNMHVCAGVHMKRREEWPVELWHTGVAVDSRSTGAVCASLRGCQMISRKCTF